MDSDKQPGDELACSLYYFSDLFRISTSVDLAVILFTLMTTKYPNCLIDCVYLTSSIIRF